MTAVVSIGSNMGNRLGFLRMAVRVLAPRAVSPVYETTPVGGPPQPNFLNAVVLCDVPAAAAWARAQQAEQWCGRVRHERWGPRTLDADLICGAGPVPLGVVLPHPCAHERAFVLAPWLDVDPDAALPGHGNVAMLLAALGREGLRLRPEMALRPARCGPHAVAPHMSRNG